MVPAVDFNWLSLIFVLGLSIHVCIEVWLMLRHRRHVMAHADAVPVAFADQIELPAHQKAARYTLAKSHIGLFSLGLDAVILLLLTFVGAIEAIYQWPIFAGLSPLWHDWFAIVAVFAVLAVIHLPLSYYRTFVLEARFGFNQSTVTTFIADIIKSTLLGLIIGGGILWVILSLVYAFGDDLWWLWAWAVWMLFSLLMIWVFPTWIAPLFNEFKPLADGEMKDRIVALLQRAGFASDGIFVMDGSKRSSHGNAYFTGLGKNKRIVFFDSLLERLNTAEVEAVLAHELGHFAHGHIRKRLIKSFITSLLGFALIAWLLTLPDFFQGLGVPSQTPGLGLLLMMQVLPVMFFWLSPWGAMRSRKDEFEADAYAVEHADGNAMMAALVKLYRDNAATLTPDPWYSAYHDSHPPASIRIGHIQRLMEKNHD